MTSVALSEGDHHVGTAAAVEEPMLDLDVLTFGVVATQREMRCLPTLCQRVPG